MTSLAGAMNMQTSTWGGKIRNTSKQKVLQLCDKEPALEKHVDVWVGHHLFNL